MEILFLRYCTVSDGLNFSQTQDKNIIQTGNGRTEK